MHPLIYSRLKLMDTLKSGHHKLTDTLFFPDISQTLLFDSPKTETSNE